MTTQNRSLDAKRVLVSVGNKYYCETETTTTKSNEPNKDCMMMATNMFVGKYF